MERKRKHNYNPKSEKQRRARVRLTSHLTRLSKRREERKNDAGKRLDPQGCSGQHVATTASANTGTN